MKAENISHKTLIIFLIVIDILLITFSVIIPDDPKTYFKEFHIITWISAVKLLSISYLTWKTYKKRAIQTLNSAFSSQIKIWFLISAGFLFLFLDEVALIHENIDKAIHIIFSMQETGLSDRLDDLIVIIYAIVGIFILHKFKDEILRFKNAIPYIVVGFFFLIIRTVIDILTNRADIIPKFIKNEELLLTTSNFLAVAEGSGKLLAETFFIVAFYYCLVSAKRTQNG